MKPCGKTNNWSYAFNYLIRKYIKKEEFLPVWATITLTTRCNLACNYCYFSQDKNIAQDMDIALAKEIINWLHKNGCRGVAIFGGEPTILEDKLIEVIKFASQKGMYIYFSTNGFLLSRDQHFLEEICKSGASVIAYAVDCVDPICGMPKKLDYQLLENLILMREKYKIRPQLNTIITRVNVPEIHKLTVIAEINEIPITSRLFSAHLLDRTIHNNYNPKLFTFNTEKDLIELDKLISDMIESKKNNPSIIIDPRESLLRIPKIARGIKAPFDCTAGKYTLSFNAQGNIYSCVDEMIRGPCFRQDLKGGQIFDKNILNQTIKNCSALCTACAEQESAYYIKHPFKFLCKFP